MAATSTTHELRELADPSESQRTQDVDALLPPTDRGKAAYLVLAGCALAQFPIWGYSQAFGIFQDYYLQHNTSSATPTAIASIGTTQTGIMYLILPILSPFLIKYPHLRLSSGPLGLLLIVVSLVGSSFTDDVGPRIATQGVLYAIGCALLFTPTSLILDDWFIERKGLAYGVMWAAKSAVGVVMPFAASGLLERYGVATTLRVWAGVSVALAVPLVFLLRPRKGTDTAGTSPDATAGSSSRTLSFSFLRQGVFWMVEFGTIVQALGYLMPTNFLAVYATSIGLSSITGPALIAAYSLASVFGSLILGPLCDRASATSMLLISSLGSAAAVFFLWGFSTNFGVLLVFALVYGFFAGSFSSTWPAVLHDLKRRDGRADTGLIFGMMMGGRGVGFLLSGPLSGVLLDVGDSLRGGISSYGSVYGPMIVCTGITAVFGAWSTLWDLGRPCRRMLARVRSATRH